MLGVRESDKIPISMQYEIPLTYSECQVDKLSEVIAEHQRSYEREVTIYDPLHSLALLEHESRALDQAAPLAGWQLPDCFAQLRRLLEARLKKYAAREYI